MKSSYGLAGWLAGFITKKGRKFNLKQMVRENKQETIPAEITRCFQGGFQLLVVTQSLLLTVPSQGSQPHCLSVRPSGEHPPALEVITNPWFGRGLGLLLHSQMNPSLFLLPGPHLCLMAFLSFPWASVDPQPKPPLAEGCDALSHPLGYPLPFAFLLARNSDILAWKNVGSLFTSSLLLDPADVSWSALLTELHLLRRW